MRLACIRHDFTVICIHDIIHAYDELYTKAIIVAWPKMHTHSTKVYTHSY